MIEQPTRRGLLIGLGAILAAPAIVRASSLMPVKVMPESIAAMLTRGAVVCGSSMFEIYQNTIRIYDSVGNVIFNSDRPADFRISEFDFGLSKGIIRSDVLDHQWGKHG